MNYINILHFISLRIRILIHLTQKKISNSRILPMLYQELMHISKLMMMRLSMNNNIMKQQIVNELKDGLDGH